jgi:hypothetical protein
LAPVSWTGDYFWENSDGSDAVLLTLLQTPSGIRGSWAETALDASDALALNGTETSQPPTDTFVVQVTQDSTTSLALTVGDEGGDMIEAYAVAGGVQLQYTAEGGGIDTVTLTIVPSTQEYDQAEQSIATTCESGSVYCGEGH